MAADYHKMARQAAVAAGIDPDLFERQIGAESNFDPQAGSSAGARGISQFMPATARGLGIDPLNPRESLYGAANLMSRYLDQYGGSWRSALTAYNSGPSRVGKPLYSETRGYINRILKDGQGGSQTARRASTPYTPSTGGSLRDRKLQYIFRGTPWEKYINRRIQRASTPYTPSTEGGGGTTATPAVSGKGKDWRWLQQTGQNLFGLQNDPGTGQTISGKHTPGSRHYAGKAIDFGTGRNTQRQLSTWYNWAQQNRERLGLAEVLWEGRGTPNEHVHVAFR